ARRTGPTARRRSSSPRTWRPAAASRPTRVALNSEGRIEMARFIDLAFAAVLLAGLYATMAYGLGLIYGVLRVVNLAHAGVIMAGAYTGWILHENWGMDPYLTIPVVLIVSFLLG